MEPRRRSPRPPAPTTARPTAISELGDLSEEIATLRQIIRLVSQTASDSGDMQETRRVLETVSRASIRLASLLKSQRELYGQGDQSQGIFNDSLKEILADLTKNL